MAVKIGGADGGNFVKKKQFKIKDGDNIYRILPSLGFNGKEPNGKWSKFYNVHFGYKNSEGKMRVFQSPLVKNRESKMVERPDAALDRINHLKAQLEKAKKEENKALYNKLLPLVGGQKPMYNMDNNHHMNAVNENGEIGVLKLRHKAKLALDAVIAALRAKGVEPLGADNGRFFVINRTGTGLQTTFTVTVKTQSLLVENVGEVQKDIVHKLTPEIIARLETEAADLDSLYQCPTSEEVDRIVKESDLLTGRSRGVDEILDRKTNNNNSEYTDSDSDEVPNAPAVTVAAVVTTSSDTPSSTVTAPLIPQTTTVSKPVAVQVQAPQAPTPALSEMSDEEFLKSLQA